MCFIVTCMHNKKHLNSKCILMYLKTDIYPPKMHNKQKKTNFNLTVQTYTYSWFLNTFLSVLNNFLFSMCYFMRHYPEGVELFKDVHSAWIYKSGIHIPVNFYRWLSENEYIIRTSMHVAMNLSNLNAHRIWSHKG